MDDIVRKLESECALAGTNVTVLCKKSKVSRTTVTRWKNKPPYTIEAINKLYSALEEVKKEKEEKKTKAKADAKA